MINLALVLLEEANTDMSNVITKGGYLLSSDFYFNNDLSKWRKTVNTFKLRVLIQLSKYEGDTDLNIKQKYAETFTNAAKYPMFTNMEDNMQYVYNAQYNKYPTNPESFGFDAARYNMTSTHLNTLVSLKDPRTFYVAEPAAAVADPAEAVALVAAAVADPAAALAEFEALAA